MVGHGYKNALVIGTEIMSRYLDWTDRNTCVLFGDGPELSYYSKVMMDTDYYMNISPVTEMLQIYYMFRRCTRNPISPQVLEQKLNCMYMDGKEVFKFAVR